MALYTAVHEELDRILASPEFCHSEQSKRLLKYLVEHSLEGAPELLKERAIGMALFGRAAGYDTTYDPIVRVRANEVRKRLAKFYQAHSASSFRIEVPVGAYRVEFLEVPPAFQSARKRRPFPVLGYALIALVVVAGLGALLLRNRGDVTDEFWGPALKNPAGVIICSGHPVVYGLTREFRERFRGQKLDLFQSQTDPVRLAPEDRLLGRDIVTIPDQYVGLGSAWAVARVHAWLAGKHKDSEIRFGTDLSFTDLRRAPAVVIGAFQNKWALELTRNMKFVFETVDGAHGVRDTQTGKTWVVPGVGEDGRTKEDYVIVSRIFNADTGQFLIVAAGLTQYGSRTAGEVITSAPILAEALATTTPGWQNRNLQMLFHVPVVGHSPGKPKLITQYVW